MRDLSASYWFSVGDSVKVVDDVSKAGVNLRNRQGTVVQTWEKCDVDPTCCCAEQVDLGMAVRVEFQGTEVDETVDGSSFYHYFAESELLKSQNQPVAVMVDDEEEEDAPNVAFDGMSCVAFKLDQLKMGQQAQRLAAFEASRTAETNDE
jgi:hypothetical protein